MFRLFVHIYYENTDIFKTGFYHPASMALTQEELFNTQETLYNFLVTLFEHMEIQQPKKKFIQTINALIPILTEQFEGLQQVKGSQENLEIAKDLENMLGNEISALTYMKRLLEKQTVSEDDIITLKSSAAFAMAHISNEVKPKIPQLQLAA